MGKKLLVIYDLDIEYGQGLLSYLKQQKSFSFEVRLITALSSLAADEEVSLLIVDQALEGMDFGGTVKQIVYLSEDREDTIHIKRYQAMDKLIEKILELCNIPVEGVNHVNSIGKTGTTCMIGIYSPAGGCGKTELARKVASHMERNKVVSYYLDFELIPNEEVQRQVDFFFDLHEKEMFKEDNWKQYFHSVDGISCLKTSMYHSELWELCEEDMNYLVQGIRGREECANYIFDIGFLNRSTISLLRNCDYWILPYREGQLASYKIRNLEQLLQFQGETTLLDKMLRFNVEHGYDEILKKLVL